MSGIGTQQTWRMMPTRSASDPFRTLALEPRAALGRTAYSDDSLSRAVPIKLPEAVAKALNRNRLLALNFCINSQDISYDRYEPY
jgi:hypothetical protein